MLDFDPIEQARLNWRQHGWGDGTKMVAATSITRAHQILLGRINAALAPHALTFSRFEVLALLYFSGRGELPLGKIGTRLQVHPTSVTSLVDRLDADGLVERVPHPDDRRTTLARLTEAGRDIVVACAAALESVEFGLREMPERDAIEISAAITHLRAEAGDWRSNRDSKSPAERD